MLGGHFSVLIFAGPLQELDQVVELLLVQVELRHLAATGGIGRHGLHPGLDEVAAAARYHVAQLGREVRAFAQQRVAADAVARFPDVLAAHHRGGDGRALERLGMRCSVSTISTMNSSTKNAVPP
jgi:hypothetical protein